MLLLSYVPRAAGDISPFFVSWGWPLFPGHFAERSPGSLFRLWLLYHPRGKFAMKEREKTAFPQKCQKMEEKVTHCMRMRKEIKIGDLSYFSGVLSYDTRQEADIISAWILKNIRRRERHDYIKWNMADELQGGRLLAGRTGAGNGLHRSASQWTDERPVCRRKRG